MWLWENTSTAFICTRYLDLKVACVFCVVSHFKMCVCVHVRVRVCIHILELMIPSHSLMYVVSTAVSQVLEQLLFFFTATTMHTQHIAIFLASCIIQNRNKSLRHLQEIKTIRHTIHSFFFWEETENGELSQSHFVVCQGGWAAILSKCKPLFPPLWYDFFILCFLGAVVVFELASKVF